MEVMVGSTFSINMSATAAAASAYVKSGSGVVAQNKVVSSATLFLGDDDDESSQVGSQIGLSGGNNSSEESSESSSSIGERGDSSTEDEDEDDAVSSRRGLGSFSSLQDSLPIKRGLSNHYSGKSKSFANLSEVSNVKELEKAENPFNKRRRVLIANKMRNRRSSSTSSLFCSWQNPKSMPLLPLQETHDDNDRDYENHGDNEDRHDDDIHCNSKATLEKKMMMAMMMKNTGNLMTRSCFCLSSLREEEEEEE